MRLLPTTMYGLLLTDSSPTGSNRCPTERSRQLTVAKRHLGLMKARKGEKELSSAHTQPFSCWGSDDRDKLDLLAGLACDLPGRGWQ